MKRSKHTLSHYRMHTGVMGKMYPIGCVPVLPGDTFQHSTNVLIRVTPLNTPVMHPVSVRIHHFFVPNRIIYDGWEDFITGGNDGLGGDQGTFPTRISTADKDALHTYLGVPPIAGITYSALPVQAANKIYNEWYRDQDLEPERLLTDMTVPIIAWEKDYFTTARPWTQRGPDVTLPLGDTAPVQRGGGEAPRFTFIGNPGAAGNLGFRASDYEPAEDRNKPFWKDIGQPESESTARWASGDIGLEADLAQAGAPSINDFRAAFSIQRYQEARARYGARFTEYLRYLGITPSDARLQRPEYLGGGTARLNFSEVLQTAPNDSSGGPEPSMGIGDLFGHGIAGARTNAYRKFFEEHGYVITMLSVRPKSIYMNGIPREFTKFTKEDFYQKELANLGQQEIFNKEVVMDHADPDATFGYQDRYHEYRSHPSQVQNDFRDTLNSWHLGRDLPGTTTLNNSFIRCNPSDRIYQVGHDIADPLWIMANHHIVARRMVPKKAVPRIL